MELKKLSTLFIASLMLAGTCLVTTGCGEKSDADKAADAVEDAGDKAADAVKGLTD
ncbi:MULTISPECIES: hypothetical protein [unclassified Lentimonas]|uniref:hypothetical protein n=1 Tax=unclassified Lentimonas TaxID=2630993 RepID=UPI00132B41C3|nr:MULTISPECIES: hypothetical protein [unclassified Lentimonas]CAA6689918.1 Unannotated [Lentimonas sp. CC10]CAA6690963.1 Unannotated [Lentimonas sp. CC19]CAA7069390.1 Unannotated [Lentimonas sp. CC11]